MLPPGVRGNAHLHEQHESRQSQQHDPDDQGCVVLLPELDTLLARGPGATTRP